MGQERLCGLAILSKRLLDLLAAVTIFPKHLLLIMLQFVLLVCGEGPRCTG